MSQDLPPGMGRLLVPLINGADAEIVDNDGMRTLILTVPRETWRSLVEALEDAFERLGAPAEEE